MISPLVRAPAGLAGPRPLQRRRLGRLAPAAAAAAEAEPEPPAAGAPPKAPETPLPPGQERIYVGKGRFIVDDPRRYPDRTELTGGFAGGEVGLWQFRETKLKPEVEAKKAAAAAAAPAKPPGPKKGANYVGRGRFLPDDGSNTAAAIRGTTRDGLQGGFAGGERGLDAFVSTGVVPFGEGGRRESSPLITAALLSFVAVGGGLLLTDAGELGGAITAGAGAAAGGAPAAAAGGGGGGGGGALAGMDESTKLLFEVGVLLVGAVGTLVAGRAAVSALASSARDGAIKLGTLAAFWVAVFIAAKLVIDG